MHTLLMQVMIANVGPNAVLYLPRRNLKEILQVIGGLFPTNSSDFGMPCINEPSSASTVIKQINIPASSPGSIVRIISTNVGDGPRLLSTDLKNCSDPFEVSV